MDEMNEKNVITKLVLSNVTGDYYSYGVVTKVNKDRTPININS